MAEDLGAITEDVKKRCMAAIDEAAVETRVVLRRLVSVPVGRDFEGRVTERSKRGEPPRMDTGSLHGSIVIEPSVYHDGEISAVIGTKIKYARRLEEGLSRPYFSTVSRLTEGILTEAMNRQFRK